MSDFESDPPPEPITLKAAQGINVAKARKERHLRQEEVAALAVNLGLGWTRATVAAIETGRRDISLVEGLFLAHVLNVKVESLLMAPRDILVGQNRYAARDWNMWVAVGDWPSTDPSGKWAAVGDVERLKREAEAALYGLQPDAVAPAMRGAILDAEWRAAERLNRTHGRNITAYHVALASISLWGRSLSDERDARLQAEGLPPGSPKATARAGWITREIEHALGEHIKEHLTDKELEERREPSGGNHGNS
jgi:transcriptional regulator with XRE-family HTH domain